MAKQQDWKKLLKADPTDWLLEEEDPCVRYLALRDIVDAGEKVVKAARRKAHREGPIAQILDNMNPEGYWVKPGYVYANKCRGTVWSVISLAQLGAFIEEDKRIATACDYLLDHAMAKGGQFSNTGQPEGTFDCLQGNLLTSLMDMGCQDKRLDTAYEWTARTVTGEGLSSFHGFHSKTGTQFACRANNNQPCSWGGVKIMMALSRLPARRRTSLVKQAIEAGVEYFFSVDPATAHFPGEKAPQPNPGWWQFHFPLFWVTDILQVTEVLTALGYGNDPRLANTLMLVHKKQDENGRWPLEIDVYRNRMWQNYGVKGKPNKWVTLRAMRVLKQAAEQ